LIGRPHGQRRIGGKAAARTLDIVGITGNRHIAESAHLERKIGATHARTLDGFQNSECRAFPYAARSETRGFRLTAPRFAFTEPGDSRTTSEYNEYEKTAEIPNTSHHI